MRTAIVRSGARTAFIRSALKSLVGTRRAETSLGNGDQGVCMTVAAKGMLPDDCCGLRKWRKITNGADYPLVTIQ